MDRQAFKNRMQKLKSYRESNPGKGYWDWKLQSFADGGETDSKIIDTLDPSIVKDSRGISLKQSIENFHNTFPNESESSLKPLIDGEKEWYDYLITEGKGYVDAGQLPEVTIKPDQIYTYLDTYYPVTNEQYKYTGHSTLTHDGRCISKGGRNKGYNLVTNNCADATLEALQLISGKKANPFLFTTPGDVRDFALEELSGEVVQDRKGETRVRIPINVAQSKKLREYITLGNRQREFANGGEIPQNKIYNYGMQRW